MEFGTSEDRTNGIYAIIADEIYRRTNIRELMELESKYELDYCYFVSGKGIAGGVASEVANIIRGNLRIDGSDSNKNIYCYTFGAMNTNTTGSGAYACIKNIINEDDLYPKIYNKEDGLMRKGQLYNNSIYDNLQREYKKLVGNVIDYKVTPKRTNTIKQKIQDVRKIINKDDWISMWLTNLSEFLNQYIPITNTFIDIFHPFQSLASVQLKKILNNNVKEVEVGHEMKSYYVLSKTLNGFDLNNIDDRWDDVEDEVSSEEIIEDLTKEEEEYKKKIELLIKSIEVVGKAYLDNVYTYHGADDRMWGIETRITDLDKSRKAEHVTEVISGQERVLKTSTVEAYEKWNERKNEVYEKIYNQLKDNIVTDEIEITEEQEKQIVELSKQMIKTTLTQMKTIENKKTTDNTTAIHHLEIFDEYKKKNNITIYNFDNTIEIGKANKGNFVGDDCSCFATAVYWYYLNQLDDAKDLDKIDLWTTGSWQFVNKSKNKNKNILDILLNNGFEIYQWEVTNNKKDLTEDYIEHNIYLNTDFKLQPGDLLYRKNGKNGVGAHVEFYLGEGKSFGWGEIHSSYDNKNESKHFKIIRDLDIYNIGKVWTGDNAPNGDTYRIDEKCKPGIYNTIKRSTDYNCRYDYVIRLEKQKEKIN